MKFYLALFTFLCSLALGAQSLTIDRNEVLLDTIPIQFVGSPTWLFKTRTIHVRCTNRGKTPVTLVVRRSTYGYFSDVKRGESNVFPEACAPGQTCLLSLEVYGNDTCTFLISGNDGSRCPLHVRSHFKPFLSFAAGTPTSVTGIEGQPQDLVYSVLNSSDVAVHVDSCRIVGEGFNCTATFPFQVQPSDTSSVVLHCNGNPGAKSFSHIQFWIFFHPEGGYEDCISSLPFIHYTHAVMITGAAEKNFGHIKSASTLVMKVTVRNNGLKPFDLDKNHTAFAQFTKHQLMPGDTATATVSWNSVFARDSFRMEIPLFTDVRNGKSTVVMRGIQGRNSSGREHSVNPDSMLWVETTHFEFDTLRRSQYRVEKAFRCRNDSPVPMVVVNTSTGDGGSMAWASTRDTIPPGGEFTVTFMQDLQSRLGPFHRGLWIQVYFLGVTNTQASKVINISGYVINDVK